MRKILFILLCLCAIPAFGQGTCSNFVGGSCPANIPAGTTAFYFIDYVGGSDTANGTSESTPWQHFPTCNNATSTAAAHTPGAGEGWILKGGVTVDFHCWPMVIPWGGTSGHSDYIGYDPGWFTGGAWARPIISGGGSSGYNSTVFSLMVDNATNAVVGSAHKASYVVWDNLEFTGLFFNTTAGGNCLGMWQDCGYIGSYGQDGNTDVGWEFRYSYVHNITHTGTYDPGGLEGGAVIWLPPDAATSAHDNYFDNSDGGDDCCQAVFAAVVYRNYFNGFDNDIYNRVNSLTGETIFLFHDNTIFENVKTFGTNGIHPNCVHLFGNQTYTEIIYNNWINCAEKGTSNPSTGESETLEVEEDFATTYIFNNILSNEYQPNGINIGDFSGTGHGGTLHIFQNTYECGMDPNNPPWGGIANEDPGFPCLVFKNDNSGNPSTGTATENNDFGISDNFFGAKAITFPTPNSWTFTSSPNTSTTCQGVTTTNFGGTLICTPLGNGNGTGNLNINETYPFAPLDSTAAATLGTASSTAVKAFCTTISGINAAAGTACLSDTTAGVAANVTNHTVSLARTPIVRPTGGANWRIGAYEQGSSQAFTCSPSTLPTNHSGHIALTCTATGGLTWNGSTAFNTSGTCTYVSTSNTGSTSQTVTVTTGGSTGTCTIADTTDSVTSPVTVATATLSISPNSGNTSTTPSLTLTGANTLWNSETPSTLFSLSGGGCSGDSLATPTMDRILRATATLTTGSAACTITVTDNSTTATATFTVTSAGTSGASFLPAGSYITSGSIVQ